MVCTKLSRSERIAGQKIQVNTLHGKEAIRDGKGMWYMLVDSVIKFRTHVSPAIRHKIGFVGYHLWVISMRPKIIQTNAFVLQKC